MNLSNKQTLSKTFFELLYRNWENKWHKRLDGQKTKKPEQQIYAQVFHFKLLPFIINDKIANWLSTGIENGKSYLIIVYHGSFSIGDIKCLRWKTKYFNFHPSNFFSVESIKIFAADSGQCGKYDYINNYVY